MTYEALNTTADKISRAKEDLDTAAQLIESAVQALEGNWSGESYNAFVAAWKESKPTLKKLSESVGAFAPELKNAVANQQERERSSASAMKSSSFEAPPSGVR